MLYSTILQWEAVNIDTSGCDHSGDWWFEEGLCDWSWPNFSYYPIIFLKGLRKTQEPTGLDSPSVG